MCRWFHDCRWVVKTVSDLYSSGVALRLHRQAAARGLSSVIDSWPTLPTNCTVQHVLVVCNGTCRCQAIDDVAITVPLVALKFAPMIRNKQCCQYWFNSNAELSPSPICSYKSQLYFGDRNYTGSNITMAT